MDVNSQRRDTSNRNVNSERDFKPVEQDWIHNISAHKRLSIAKIISLPDLRVQRYYLAYSNSLRVAPKKKLNE